jgi:hypothetical protein
MVVGFLPVVVVVVADERITGGLIIVIDNSIYSINAVLVSPTNPLILTVLKYGGWLGVVGWCWLVGW